MSRRPFDPRELDQTPGHDPVVSEIERYADLASTEVPPRDFADRLMSTIDVEASRRRTPLAWLTAPLASLGGSRRMARATAFSAAVALALAGVLVAGQLARIVHDLQAGASPSPGVIESHQPLPSVSPATRSQTPSEPRSASPDESRSPGASGAPSGSEPGGASPAAGGSDDESETPVPSRAGSSSDG